jgi:8-oxo-dGTP pyrophosphatase MutT (NUDIX family)
MQVINESELRLFEKRLPMPLSLIVVVFSARVLLMFNRWRGQWELPGGMREPGEAPRRAAVRELDEETGIATADLDFALIAEFSLQRPSRREYAAVYRTRLDQAPVLLLNDEASAFQWWEPRSSIGEHMSPLDTAIARHVYSR